MSGISDIPPRMPSSLTEVGERLAAIEQKIDRVLAALKTDQDITLEVAQERITLAARVDTLEHEVALLKGKAA